MGLRCQARCNHHLRRQCSLYSINAGVKGNNRADRLGAKAAVTSGLRLRRSEVLRSLRQYPRTQSQGHHTLVRLEKKGVESGSARQSALKGHHTLVRLEKKGVESGSARQSALKGRKRATSIQTNTGTVLKAMLGKLLRDESERIWAFRRALMPLGTELN